MNDVVKLQGFQIALGSELGLELTVDLARYSEGLLDESAIRKKYRFDDDVWASLASNDVLVEAIEKEKAHRIKSGACARERAQLLFAGVPTVLGNILHDEGAAGRMRIESAKELRVIAANGPEAAPTADRFQITIIMGDETLQFDKSIAVNPNDTDPCNPDDTNTTLELSAFTASATKKKDGDGGEYL